jgi:hypothetical protein
MNVTGYLRHKDLSPGEDVPGTHRKKAGWASDLLSTLQRTEKNSPLSGVEPGFISHSACGLAYVLTELSRLHIAAHSRVSCLSESTLNCDLWMFLLSPIK